MINVQSKSIKTDFTKVVECDFTQSNYWFTLYSKHSNVSDGRNSTWLYWYTSDYSYKAIQWNIPSSIYSLWTPLKIELQLYWTKAWCWWWISYWLDQKVARIWWRWLEINFSQNTYISTNTPANQSYKLTIDLKNKKMYSDLSSSYTLNLTDADIEMIRWYWSSWSLWICWMLFNTGNLYAYIQKATFTIE